VLEYIVIFHYDIFLVNLCAKKKIKKISYGKQKIAKDINKNKNKKVEKEKGKRKLT
jgi:hypothetical protein